MTLPEYIEDTEQWENGQDLSLTELLQSSSESEQLPEQSSEAAPQESYSEPIYNMSSFAGYSYNDLGYTLGTGMCAGFAVTFCVALASWAISCVINILKKGAK